MSEDFMQMVQEERTRIRERRETLFVQHRETEDQLAALNRELSALDAYETVKTGQRPKGAMLALPAPGKKTPAPRLRRDSKRESVLNLIEGTPGMRRGELLDRMGLKGNKTGEMSVSNALTALTKTNRVERRHGGHYHAVAAH